MNHKALQIMPLTKVYGGWAPVDTIHLPLFRHFCEGMIAVKNIDFFKSVFEEHGWCFVLEGDIL